jgi:6-pyruvoyltetrahydropterin/6-carboxytetrahydropterin synthase
MFYNAIYDHFSSAHRLKDYEGSCENIHGHNFKVKVIVCGEKLNNIHFLVDFRTLKSILKEILKKLDHKFLNDIDYFDKTNPTAEMIAKYIFENFSNKLKEFPNVKTYEVVVWESEINEATYRP